VIDTDTQEVTRPHHAGEQTELTGGASEFPPDSRLRQARFGAGTFHEGLGAGLEFRCDRLQERGTFFERPGPVVFGCGLGRLARRGDFITGGIGKFRREVRTRCGIHGGESRLAAGFETPGDQLLIFDGHAVLQISIGSWIGCSEAAVLSVWPRGARRESVRKAEGQPAGYLTVKPAANGSRSSMKIVL
jgi:hypothetical protein